MLLHQEWTFAFLYFLFFLNIKLTCFVADGYGVQYIMHYNSKGELLNTFGGRGDEESHLDNAHGVCIDTRKSEEPILLITDRNRNKLKRFSMSGDYLSNFVHCSTRHCWSKLCVWQNHRGLSSILPRSQPHRSGSLQCSLVYCHSPISDTFHYFQILPY